LLVWLVVSALAICALALFAVKAVVRLYRRVRIAHRRDTR
jgi:hypothetical protein